MTLGNSSYAWGGEAKPGKDVYEKLYVSCHGADGKGNPGMAKVMGEKGLNIVRKRCPIQKDEELIKVIVEGKGKMPAGKNLFKQEQKEVLSYTRDLAK